MIEIMKASAGSGKTFNLAKKYIGLLLQNGQDDAYRHILAVTFTNKATGEMKSRILEELKLLADTPKESKYLEDFLKIEGMSLERIQYLSGKYLRSILHDYSAFAVSTIDKFFQQTLKAFSREVGYMSSYQIELDQDSLLQETVDRILDSITEDNVELIKWMNDNMMDQLKQGKRFSLDGKLVQTACRLRSSKFESALKKYGLSEDDVFDKGKLNEARKKSMDVKLKFQKDVQSAALILEPSLPDNVLKFLLPYKSCQYYDSKLECPKPTLLKKAEGSEFSQLFEDGYTEYSTACIVADLTYALGFAGDFRKGFAELLREKNVLGLDDSNTLLKKIIDGSDAPFVYEKLGVRYEHFLLDEFQDTSHVQWDNFIPLIRESEDNGHDNLIVGDVKQSIYRWRDSDWNLLAKDVEDRFPNTKINPLKENHRSLFNVVDFNDNFFEFVVKKLDETFGSIDGSRLSDLYSDVRQSSTSKEIQKGMVKVSFCDKKTKDDGSVPVLEEIGESIDDALKAGARYGDIAILVRSNNDGGRVAEYLLRKGLPVVSDDSLDFKMSFVVRLLAARLSLADNPEDKLSKMVCEGFDTEVSGCFHSLVDMCEDILRKIERVYPLEYESEATHIQSFMDYLQDWVSLNGNDLHLFLKKWKVSKDTIASSPSDSDAVRIMTIHKSKGLQFPYVIVPYIDKASFSGKDNWDWCENEGLLYPVDFSKSDTPTTSFLTPYREEMRRVAVDAVNVCYVAFTRASKCLHIISLKPSQKCQDSFKKDAAFDFGNMGEVLYWFVKGMDKKCYGQMYDFTEIKRKVVDETGIEADYHSISIGKRLKPSTDAADYFGEDGHTGALASARISGIELHSVLAGVSRVEDFDKYSDEPEYEMLRQRVKSHPEWFSGNGMNEVNVIGADGFMNRPDRVVINDSCVTVIDYKFGAPDKSYVQQVCRYMDLYKKLGYSNVNGYVWYVREDNVVPCQ